MRRTLYYTILLLAGALPVAADDWPVFRGNSAQTGIAAGTLPESLAVLWTATTGNTIESSPVVANNTIFVGNANGKLRALDLTNGKQKWEYPTAGLLASPAVHDDAVYVGDVKGVFHCIDAVTGKRRWIISANGEILTSANFGKDRIVFGANDFNLYCVDSAGKLLWKYKTKEKIRGTATVVGDRVLVGGCDQLLHVVDLAKGQAVATIDLGGHVAGSVAVRDEHAFVGTMANQFLTVDWKKENVQWRFQAKRNAQAFHGSPAATADLVVAGSRDKVVRAWQRQTGKEVWAFSTKGRVDSSPAIVGSRVIIGSLDGHLYVLDLARGTAQARFELGPIASAPAVVDSRVIVATVTGEVVCLGTKK